MKKHALINTVLIFVLIVVGTLGRLASNHLHLWNFAPIGAMALFGGAVISNKRYAFFLPLAALFLSDLCLQLFTPIKGFYGWSQMLNYAAFMGITLLGIWMKKITLKSIVWSSLAASLFFFLVSNFGVWLFSAGVTYPLTRGGLLSCYLAGIPFFGNTLLGDLFYCGILFGSYFLVRQISAFRKLAA
ncbi:MAG: DUF6580 family putative transport protein [Chitinophagaceae bacterium]